MNKFRTRLAPTPSGLLHIGNAYNFLLTAQIAKHFDGAIFLRIDDIDETRLKDQYLENIFKTLDFLQIKWNEGPRDVKDFHLQFSQHLRIPLYEAYLQKLKNLGMLYPCKLSRKQIFEISSTGIYHGELNESLSFEEPELSWRIHVPKNTIIQFRDQMKGEVSINLYEAMGDFVVRRRDGIPSFQIVSLVDDLHYKINNIVRGEDLLNSTAAQLYLAHLLDEKSFHQTNFYHHHLLKNENGDKLSKSVLQNNEPAIWESFETLEKLKAYFMMLK